MAVTQQLARVSPQLLESCRQSVDKLAKVIDFSELPRNAYLDLDWFPAFFRIWLHYEYGESDLYRHFCESVDGDDVVNSEFPEFEVDVVPRFVDQDRVLVIADFLERVNSEELIKELPSDLRCLNMLLGSDFVSSPRSYFRDYWKRLVKFYVLAAKSRSTVMMWWD